MENNLDEDSKPKDPDFTPDPKRPGWGWRINRGAVFGVYAKIYGGYGATYQSPQFIQLMERIKNNG